MHYACQYACIVLFVSRKCVHTSHARAHTTLVHIGACVTLGRGLGTSWRSHDTKTMFALGGADFLIILHDKESRDPRNSSFTVCDSFQPAKRRVSILNIR